MSARTDALTVDGIATDATCWDLFLPKRAEAVHAMYKRLLGACPCESGQLVAMLRPVTHARHDA